MYKTILVTLDGTPTDRAIIEHIKQLATLMHSRVVLLHVAEASAAAQWRGPDAGGKEVDESQAYLDRVQAEFEPPAFPPRPNWPTAIPVTEIVKWVARERLRPGGHEHARAPASWPT